ncbi:MAG: class I SAM-dependent methyltransferase [Pseudomonadota bacterium]
MKGQFGYNNQTMGQDSIWELYWQVRLQSIEDLGKCDAVLAASQLIRDLDVQGQPARLLELGCGAGQIIGALMDAHAELRGMNASVGVDYSASMLAKARRACPNLHLVQGDYTDPAVLDGLGQFQLVLLVNSLHEVFSANYAKALGEIDVPAGRAAVARALSVVASLLTPGGYLLVFDGLEPPGDPERPVTLRFLDPVAREEFHIFAAEYHPFRVHARWLADGWQVEISQHNFARYIDKSMFIRKALWQTERLESYQYFTEDDFRHEFSALDLRIVELRTLTVSGDHWRSRVSIETPGIDFPPEHVLIIATRPRPASLA